jgi:hypothetical protein
MKSFGEHTVLANTKFGQHKVWQTQSLVDTMVWLKSIWLLHYFGQHTILEDIIFGDTIFGQNNILWTIFLAKIVFWSK